MTRLPPLKDWAKDTIKPDDWNFSALIAYIQEEQLRRPLKDYLIVPLQALWWELDRELGSGNGSFLEQAKVGWWQKWTGEVGRLRVVSDVGAIEHEIQPPPWGPEQQDKNGRPLPVRIREWPLGKFVHLLAPGTERVAYETCEGVRPVVALELPPYLSDEDELVEAFRLFLRHRGFVETTHDFKVPAWKRKLKREKGRRKDWRSWFSNLGAYRLKRCGFTHDEARDFTEQPDSLYTKSPITIPKDPGNFSRGVSSVREKILLRYKYLVASFEYEKKRGALNALSWRDFFLKHTPIHTPLVVKNRTGF